MMPNLAMLGWPEVIGLAVILGSLIFVPFWIWMLVDCALHERPERRKIVWILVVLLTSCIGAPLYFFVRWLPRRKLPPPV